MSRYNVEIIECSAESSRKKDGIVASEKQQESSASCFHVFPLRSSWTPAAENVMQ